MQHYRVTKNAAVPVDTTSSQILKHHIYLRSRAKQPASDGNYSNRMRGCAPLLSRCSLPFAK